MTRDISKRAPKRPQSSFRSYLAFIMVGIAMMILLDFFIWDERPYVDDIKTKAIADQQLNNDSAPQIVRPEDGSDYFEAPDDLGEFVEIPEETPKEIEEPQEETSPVQTDQNSDLKDQEKEDQPKLVREGTPAKVAIVIDDVGMNIKQSRAAINLPKEVTLAFLPYADKVKELSSQAKEEGHELIIHAPMEAMNEDIDLGPIALRTTMDYASFDQAFQLMTDSFDGYVGVNNHMGSRLTQAPEQMAYLMDQLKQRDLFFLDSRTIHTSIALDMARAYGIPAISRDVFLDHEETEEYLQKALRNVERIAREQGVVVAIGHPKAITMSALNKWIPTLKEKNMVLVPLSELIDKPMYKVVNNKSN